MDLTRSRARIAGRGLALAVVAALTTSCSLTTSPPKKPTTAHIIIEGSTPAPLELVTSTDFYQTQNQTTLEVNEVYNKADTLGIGTLPYDATVDLTDLGSISVRLKNPVVATASVRMRVTLDNGQGYDQTATLSDGASLVYVYTYSELLF